MKVLIVGGGLAGLSAGIFARLNGFEAEILEQQATPGGVCTSWKRKGYTMDSGIHWLSGSAPGTFLRTLYETVGIFSSDNRVAHEWVRTDELVRLGAIGRDDKRLVAITSDLERLEREWVELSPEDAAPVRELFDAIRGIDQLKVFERYRVSVADYCRRIRNPWLKWQIGNVYAPEVALPFLLLVLKDLGSGNLGYMREGSLAIAQAMARRFEELGGFIHYRADVEKILVEDGNARGVRLKGGQELQGSYVVAAGDLYSTYFELLGESLVPAEQRNAFGKYPLSPPLLFVNFGLKRKLGQAAQTYKFLLDRGIPAGAKDAQELGITFFDDYRGYAPPDGTCAQVILRTDFETWSALSKDKAVYRARKQEVADLVLGTLELAFPGFRGAVEVTDVSTPVSMLRHTRNFRGAGDGWHRTPEVVERNLPKTVPGVSRLFLAGQWVEPGGGVPIVLLSGRNAIRMICQSESIGFKISAGD